MKKIQKILISRLWESFIPSVPEYKSFTTRSPLLDHMAIIDITSEHSNRLIIEKIMEKIGYIRAGAGYLPEKFNDFIWMHSSDSDKCRATEALPQLVFADFRIELHSVEVQKIIRKYTKAQLPFDFEHLDRLIEQVDTENAAQHIFNFIINRPWPTPTLKDYMTVKQENQLLAWVLLFGKRVNHFGLNLTFEPQYNSLAEFNAYVKNADVAQINSIDGEIKGDRTQGIQQSSTVGKVIKYQLPDGEVEVNDSFMEFVWRFPKNDKPVMWDDYFTGFVAQNANRVIESLYDYRA